ncbi:MAG: hypothetical protein EAZ39_22475 [Oscillatoriales cyanobacterium]|nr:MAG: hypothetical protein EAZ45_04635 [Oscillatoriales cyanobacterium]TAG15077.1 MAG: hypothetical protein EAZ39_22475 [Oscillatoriales cyanobacterium]TAG36823.1 MAG: hypothetical protein EAZ33_23000 [Oscillatoriales cyanobacterium]TAG68820.1 MAG: hypothetical protein EAZ25_01820 [Oscillatoriales cyanobacterium]
MLEILTRLISLIPNCNTGAKTVFLQHELPTLTKETGFFTESAGDNEIFSQKNPVSAYSCVQEYLICKQQNI